MGLPSLKSIVKRITGFPDPAAQTTADFIASKKGVRQALSVPTHSDKLLSHGARYMARDEMSEITEARWVDDLWGAVGQGLRPRMVLYFGEDDHWVANRTRAQLIAAAEAAHGLKPRMYIDDNGIPHSFCIRQFLHWKKRTLLTPPGHNDVVAQKVADWIKEIAEQGGGSITTIGD